MRGMKRISLLLGLALTFHSGASSQAPDIPESKVDAVFSRWTSETPGCAVGVADGGRPVLQKAYGMADLEHDVPNTRRDDFEAGSVSKQFTAAAVLLLAREGKLSLDDPVRKYVPELPDYGAPLTIRHMLHHTSGLRDWGEVASIAGWPRTAPRPYSRARPRHRQPAEGAELPVRARSTPTATPATTSPPSSSRA